MKASTIHPTIAAELGLARFRQVSPASDPEETPLVPPGTPLPEPPAEDSTALTAPASPPHESKKPRNGKIARLPKGLRDMVNRMLFRNVPQENIAAALDDCGIKVTQRNISNWRTRGGYREWRLAQEHAHRLRVQQDNLVDLVRRHDASDLPEVGLQAAATHLSLFLLTPAAQELLASNPREYERRVTMLARISAQVKALQQYRDDSARKLSSKYDPERVRRDADRELAILQECFTAAIPEGPADELIPHRNELPDPTKPLVFGNPEPPTFGEIFQRHKEEGRQRVELNESISGPSPSAPDSPAAAGTDAP